jgi:protein SDA1
MGAHKLCVLGFYTYIMKYLTYHQLRIPAILVSLAQSVHDLTPPDALTPVIRKIAQEFVHPGVGGEVNTAGLNAIREVCRRQPWSMEEDLLGDLVAYRKSRDKAVTSAARGLLQLYREVNPGMLKRRERVRAFSITSRSVFWNFTRAKMRVWDWRMEQNLWLLVIAQMPPLISKV